MADDYTPRECPTCGGEGATYEQVRVGQFATPFVCSACDGSGEAQGYTPTTDEVRDYYANGQFSDPDMNPNDHARAFDRWLTAHDAEVRKDEREKVAAEIEMSWRSKPPIPSRAESESVNDYLQGVRFGKITAARIARGGGGSGTTQAR